MKVISRLSVHPRLPKELARLNDIAYNLWWSWEPEAQALYASLDAALWESTNHNPVKFLQRVSQAALDKAAANTDYRERLASVAAAFDDYMSSDASTWFKRTYPDKINETIAYFSAEFGLHEALPIYSGGLGVLAGDHCKSASDLGLPFIGVGFLYPQGYFTQQIDGAGVQQAVYEKIDFAEVPALPAVDPQGREVLIHVDLPGRTVYAKVWKIQVGRIPIYLMDTDVPRNAPPDRELSARLYGGDREMRISQEVVLGIGGVRAVRALGYDPAVWHMNEGHSAFLGIERVRELVQGQGMTWHEAGEYVRGNTLFTTHTPVPAGNDSFAFELVEKFFWQYWGALGVTRDQFMNFARQELPWGPQYSMTVLALRLSCYANGVSRLHGEVSRGMWNFLWPNTPVSEVPIGSITNGVHTKTWLQQELRSLYAEYFGGAWGEEFDLADRWHTDAIPAGELWQAHQTRKEKMVELVRERLTEQALRHGEGTAILETAKTALDPRALVLGFARRFATYKRATLIFRDEERLLRLLSDPERPVQLVFAGKAHPADEPGKSFIQRIYQLSHEPQFAGKIVFVEDYDMNIARHLISGVDVWLNNPRRPLEASGTSGEKAAVNGIPNFSALDGWWEEGFDGENGWAIGESRSYKDDQTQDEADALSLYQTLEQEIIPLYFNRTDAGVPEGWVAKMRNAIQSCGPRFSMDRQVKDYVNIYYLPAAATGAARKSNNYQSARDLARWRDQVRSSWNGVHIHAETEGPNSVTVDESVTVKARVNLNGLPAELVSVEAVWGRSESADALTIVPLNATGTDGEFVLYSGVLTPHESGRLEIGVRVRPNHPAQANPYEIPHMTWA